MELRDRVEGCLFGLAVGDALGAPVEFMKAWEIRNAYGVRGLATMEPWSGFPAGSYTDDTQMALATIKACLDLWEYDGVGGRVALHAALTGRYLEWLDTQDDPRQRRAPGMTCLGALRSGTPVADSKGCGGVMRTPPIGLLYHSMDAFYVGMTAAGITHGHRDGMVPAGAAALIVALLRTGTYLLDEAVDIAIRASEQPSGGKSTVKLLTDAKTLASGSLGSDEAIRQLGEGWVGDEALAIAVFCALRFRDDVRTALQVAVNHDGDSDSTGCIAGAILGTKFGVQALPQEWLAVLEGRDEIQALADRVVAVAGKR